MKPQDPKRANVWQQVQATPTGMAPFRARPAPDDPLPTHDISKELEIEPATAVLENDNDAYTTGNSLTGAEKSGSGSPDDSSIEADAERGHRDSDEKRASEKTWLLARKEEVEITPVEAFGVDVSGDQSPCELADKNRADGAVPEVAACVPNTDDPSLPVGSECGVSTLAHRQPFERGSS